MATASRLRSCCNTSEPYYSSAAPNSPVKRHSSRIRSHLWHGLLQYGLKASMYVCTYIHMHITATKAFAEKNQLLADRRLASKFKSGHSESSDLIRIRREGKR